MFYRWATKANHRIQSTTNIYLRCWKILSSSSQNHDAVLYAEDITPIWTTFCWKWWDKCTSNNQTYENNERVTNEFLCKTVQCVGSWNPWPRNRKLSDTRWSGKRWCKQCDGIHILLIRSWVELEIRSSTVMIRSIYPWDLMRLKYIYSMFMFRSINPTNSISLAQSHIIITRCIMAIVNMLLKQCSSVDLPL